MKKISLLLLLASFCFGQDLYLNNNSVKLGNSQQFYNYGSRLQYILMRLEGGSQLMQQAGREVLPYSPQDGKDSVRIMVLGDSNSDTQWGDANTWWTTFPTLLGNRFTNATILDSTFALAGGSFKAMVSEVQDAIYAFRPDLIIWQNLQNDESKSVYEFWTWADKLMRVIRYNSVADVAIIDYTRTTDVNWNHSHHRILKEIADFYNAEFIDVAWAQMDTLKASGDWASWTTDNTHLNNTGDAWMAREVLKHFPKRDSTTIQINRNWNDRRIIVLEAEDNWEWQFSTFDVIDTSKWNYQGFTPGTDEFYASGNSWISIGTDTTDTLEFDFIGNGVEVWTYGNRGGGEGDEVSHTGYAYIYLSEDDGTTWKKPSEFNLWYATRPEPDAGNGSNLRIGRPFRVFPARSSSQIAQTWTISFDQGNDYEYSLSGSVTGADGTGSDSTDFLSTSELITIREDDFVFKSLTVSGDEFTFYVRSMFQDSIQCDSQYMKRHLVANGLKNKKYRFRLITKGDNSFGLDAIAIFRPPLWFED